MSHAQATTASRGFGQTERRDTWWATPLAVFLGFSTFIVYATWAAFQGEHYVYGPYLSPFYSPEIFGSSPHSWFGPFPDWWPAFVPASPALLILPIPGGFRFTCYYYRGAYYKAFWADPPSCAVGEPRTGYRGENSFPLILQNVHRYVLYLTIAVLVVLIYDAWKAFWFTDAAGVTHFGVGLGTVLLAANVVLLSFYVGGCHSLRHVVGGKCDVLAHSKVRQSCYRGVSACNRKHMLWAWCSLFTVGFSDLYVRLCSMGIWTDWRLL
jgi:hypothetical protein